MRMLELLQMSHFLYGCIFGKVPATGDCLASKQNSLAPDALNRCRVRSTKKLVGFKGLVYKFSITWRQLKVFPSTRPVLLHRWIDWPYVLCLQYFSILIFSG
jgi:hypothetical protein